MEALENELKQLLIDTLNIEGMAATDIDSETALFGTGLGLDSLDALELAIAIKKQYGVRTDPDDEMNQRIFRTVRTLAAYVGTHRDTEQA